MTERKKTSIIWTLEKEKFVNLVKESTSIGQILNFFGLKNKGRNSDTVKTRMIKENIDFSHIPLGVGCNKGRKFAKRKNIPMSEILVENSSYTNRTVLKERLVKEGYLEYKCECCNNTGLWNNVKLVLQLEHKNGISNDNRIENLTFLCPNCHSQTSTFGGKSRQCLVV
jgi:Zn finger protein HypA/HybF involved in hydrogenase expression